MKNYFVILKRLSTRLASHVDKSLAPQLFRFLLTLYRSSFGLLWGPVCRMTPSCSQYADDCYRTHGWWHASGLVIRRLLCCHPFHDGGFDPL